MAKKKEFRDLKHPELGDDLIALDFSIQLDRNCIKFYAFVLKDKELKQRIEKRIKHYMRLEKIEDKRMDKKRAYWRNQNCERRDGTRKIDIQRKLENQEIEPE